MAAGLLARALVQVVGRLLERLGYACTGFTDARAALRTFAADPNAFDAVITDGAMPHMTGPQMAVEMRALRPDVPIDLRLELREAVEPA